MAVNLHALVRNAITALHPDETVTLYRSLGQINDRGTVTARYAPPETVRAQIQSQSANALYHADRAGRNDSTRRAYFYAADRQPDTLNRPLARTGDMIRRTDGTWWLVDAMLEDFTAAGWVSVRLDLQIKAPDLSASDWWEGDDVEDDGT